MDKFYGTKFSTPHSVETNKNKSRNAMEPENSFTNKGIVVELIKLHRRQSRDHIHKILRDDLHLRHCGKPSLAQKY